jgi:carbamoyl-phosphate synthase large subunit
MALGRTFLEACFKGLRSLEHSRAWFQRPEESSTEQILEVVSRNSPDRLPYLLEALRRGVPEGELAERTRIDPWFLGEFGRAAREIARLAPGPLDRDSLRRAKRLGLSDRYLAHLKGVGEMEVRARRKELGVVPAYKMVDTCAAEFAAATPYFYSSYDEQDETVASDKPKVLILGSGPNRIGQGIEFDYACVQASYALHDLGYETIMLNCNPETVSTDYDTSDRLYFDPVTLEDVLNLVDKERPIGAVVQFGGQTPLNLARALEDCGVRILGTSPAAIDRAESREEFSRLVESLGLAQAPGGAACSLEEALAIAGRVGYPVLARPSYILGGRSIELVFDPQDLRRYVQERVRLSAEHPVLIDRFLEDAFEYDIDAVADGSRVVIGAVMEHIEEAGIHSGDSACSIPPIKSKPEWIRAMKEQTRRIALELGVVGLLNIQFAVKDDKVYVLEVNPRASRTVPFVSKATGLPLVRIASGLLVGRSLGELGVGEEPAPLNVAVKECVLPFDHFPGVDPVLAPEMRSTGEVMGLGASFGEAFYKAQAAAGMPLPAEGTVFISVHDNDKEAILPVARRLAALGLRITATKGTAEHLWANGVWADVLRKVHEDHPNALDYIRNGKVALLVNTPLGRESQRDDYLIRDAAIAAGIPYTTTTSAALAAVEGIEARLAGHIFVRHLQENPRRNV